MSAKNIVLKGIKGIFRYLWSCGGEALIRGENIPDTALWDFVPGRGGTRVAVKVDVCLTI